MEENVFEYLMVVKKKEELRLLSSMNQKTERFGLALGEEEINELVEYRNQSLKTHNRIEFGDGILEKLIYMFCDSQHINQKNYLLTLEKLQDIFYKFRNDTLDLMTDDEILTFMKEQYETLCAGDLEYLESTCMENFSKEVRGGYDGYIKTGGEGDYAQFDEVPRWDKELYLQELEDLFW